MAKIRSSPKRSASLRARLKSDREHSSRDRLRTNALVSRAVSATSRKSSRKPKPSQKTKVKGHGRSVQDPAAARASTPPRAAGLRIRIIVLISAALLLLGTAGSKFFARPRSSEPPPTAPAAKSGAGIITQRRVHVHARYAHDASAFTQGLVWDHGRLFESTGLVGRSSLREVELESGLARRLIADDAVLFGEGLALVDGELFQLTWRDRRALVWDASTFALHREIAYQGEGWGLCYDGQQLVMSDGTSKLYFRNKQSFAVERTLEVTRNAQPQPMLNELECVHGKIYANVWQSDEIVRIDAASGAIDEVIDASGLLGEHGGADVLNGIAFVPETGKFLVTGKLWPTLFEVTFE
jgi:glutamine cyclotransferase